jgi:tetratricopeptide (TPR) repeat protein
LSTVASSPDQFVAEAVRLYNAGDLAAAEAASRNALALSPRHSAANAILGAVLLAQGRFGEADSTFSELAEREPREPSHWVNLGTARRGLKQFDKALAAYSEAARLGEKTTNWYFNVGLTHIDRGDFTSALAVLEQARALTPRDAEVCFRYAQASYRALKNDAALSAISDWRTLESASASMLAQIAQLLVNLGSQQEGERALEAALSDQGADAATLLTGIEVYERINRLVDAQALIRRLESDQRSASVDEDLLITRARLAQRVGDHATAERLYGQSLLATQDPALKHMELFPLAQSLDALGRFDEAWATLLEAHASQLAYLRRAFPALVLGGAPPMQITQHDCDPADVAAWQDDAPSIEDSPVFVVAFPRSGTTLLEMTLDAHPMLRSMDEQPFIQDALEEIRQISGDYPRQLARLSRVELAELRARYWRRAAGKVELNSGVKLVDKNPLNILRLPVIRRLFPHAPVLFGVRHPCDIIVSCYMQHFRAPEFALLCNTLPSIARALQRTVDFWFRQAVILEPRSREVRYEALVSDFETEVRGIIGFLELPWDDRVLDPAGHAREKGFISTPSYAQVVGPVSTKSVDRWRRYARRLAPVLPIIEPQLDRWAYSAVVAVDGVSPNSK